MAYADYDFYKNEYLGRAITENDFPRLALRGSQYIDYITQGRAEARADLEAVKMCCCELAEQYQVKHMLWCQSKGLQGHKRLNRYESSCDRAHYIKMQNYCIDMFGEVIEPDWDYTVAAPEDIKGYLEAYLNWENSVYTRLGAISNSLETMGLPCEAALVRHGLPEKEIGKVRRMLTEYGLAGWDMAYILFKDKELHDKIKKLEKFSK